MLGVMAVFAGTSYAQRTVTLTLNTATLADTVSATSEIQIRGAVGGAAPTTLPDGNIIDWGSGTTLKPANVGGDVWELMFQIPNDQELKFKFFSLQSEDPNGDGNGSDGIGGWEDGSSNTDGDGNHIVPAGTGDVDLGLHYFTKGSRQLYDWRPFASKPDTVGVWFRIYMNTEAAVAATYKGDGTDVIGIRGDNLGGVGPLDWGATQITLNRESSDNTKPGYHLYSGVAYYPTSLAGQTQAFKFFVNPAGWEDPLPNRTFTIPANDSTLQWVYFANSKPLTGQSPVAANVIFTVDIQPLLDVNLFSTIRGDSLQVRGQLNGWTCSTATTDQCKLQDVPGPTWEQQILVTELPDREQPYKFFVEFGDTFESEVGFAPPEGWEEPLDFGGGNRQYTFTGENPLFLDIQFFNDIRPGNVIPAGAEVEVTFQVDMTPAEGFAVPFNPAADTVRVDFEDPLWITTQLIAKGVTELDPVLLSDPEGDGIYTGTYTITGPTYNGIGYRYEYGSTSGGYLSEGEGGTDPGRRRYQYIQPNPDGSWPSTFTFQQVTTQANNPMPFECNPTTATHPEACVEVTAVEEVGGELPTQISLGQNYPNPFNPNTAFEYKLDGRADVKVRVYDVTGRLVTTLFEGTQPAGTYRVTFSGEGLASGTYFYRLETPRQTFTRSMVLVK
jgi:hypothetical protein